MKKILSVTSAILVLAIAFTCLTGCNGLPQHVHAFSEEWEKNELCHWHVATCKHDELTSNLGVHTYGDDGKCTVCGFEDPGYVPEPVPHVDEFWLPSSSTDYNNGEVYSETTYSYDDDLHGYVETRTVYDEEEPEDYRKYVKTYDFNEDYSEWTLIETEYDVENGEESVWSQRKYEVKTKERYYEERCDYWDFDAEKYVMEYIVVNKYNSRNQPVLKYEICDGAEEGKFYYYYAYEYEYDEDGYILRRNNFGGPYDDDDEEYDSDYVTCLYSFDVYEYAEDKMSAVEKSYYYSNGGYYLTDYTEITSEIIDGIRYDTEKIHFADGRDGNVNRYGYAENWERVYVKYSGLPAEESLKRNEFGQVDHYYQKFAVEETVVNVEYAENGGNILSSVKTEKDFDLFTGDPTGEKKMTSVYSYNDAGQIAEVNMAIVGHDSFSGENYTEEDPFRCKATVTYTTLQNDELLKHIELFDSIIKNYTDHSLIYGLT